VLEALARKSASISQGKFCRSLPGRSPPKWDARLSYGHRLPPSPKARKLTLLLSRWAGDQQRIVVLIKIASTWPRAFKAAEQLELEGFTAISPPFSFHPGRGLR